NNSTANSIIIKNKDTRSESVDSFSSTIDVHAPFKQSKQTPDDARVDADSKSSAFDQFHLVNKEGTTANAPTHQFFDIIPPQNRSLTQEEQLLRQALNSILVLNSTSCPEVQSLLDAYNGHLVDIDTHLLEGLRHAAPPQLAARVGDYNENLFYEMRDIDQNIGSIIIQGSSSSDNKAEEHDQDTTGRMDNNIESFETSIRQSLQRTNVTYRGSFMQTEHTMYQPAHVDYDYPILQMYGKR
ncbi:hypothetical protein ACHAXR_000281, partial [Thalassiosira sp. AJA248-18]